MLLDLRMPCMDGHEVLEALERGQFGVQPPTVIVSCSSRPEDRALVDSFSFVVGYLEKPLRSDDLLAMDHTVETFPPIFNSTR